MKKPSSMGPTDGWINKCGDRLGRNRVPVGDLELAIAADSFGLNHDLILGSERGALTWFKYQNTENRTD